VAKKRFLKWRPSVISNLKKYSNLITRVSSSTEYDVVYCVPFNQNRIIFRISAILNFRGPINSSLKSSCRTSSTVNREFNLILSFWENRIFVCILVSDRQTNGQTDGKARCVKPLSCGERRRLINPVRSWRKKSANYRRDGWPVQIPQLPANNDNSFFVIYHTHEYNEFVSDSTFSEFTFKI